MVKTWDPSHRRPARPQLRWWWLYAARLGRGHGPAREEGHFYSFFDTMMLIFQVLLFNIASFIFVYSVNNDHSLVWQNIFCLQRLASTLSLSLISIYTSWLEKKKKLLHVQLGQKQYFLALYSRWTKKKVSLSYNDAEPEVSWCNWRWFNFLDIISNILSYLL